MQNLFQIDTLMWNNNYLKKLIYVFLRHKSYAWKEFPFVDELLKKPYPRQATPPHGVKRKFFS